MVDRITVRVLSIYENARLASAVVIDRVASNCSRINIFGNRLLHLSNVDSAVLVFSASVKFSYFLN